MTVKVTKPAINVREELADLRKPTGIAGEAMLRAETPQEQFNLIGAGRRNILINGDFSISQRGDYSSATATANNVYSLDRWSLALSSVTGSVQHNEVVLPNGTKTMAMKVAGTSTNASIGYVGIRQVVEDFRVLSGQIVTASMWVRTNLHSLTFRHDSTINFGDYVTPDGQWHYHTATYQMPTITSTGRNANQTTLAIINYTGSAGGGVTSGEYFEVAQVQLELGKVATPFEHRSYGEELALCQRYYERIQDHDPQSRDTSGVTSSEVLIGLGVCLTSSRVLGRLDGWKVTKRAAPTVSISDNTQIEAIHTGAWYPATNTVNFRASIFGCRVDFTHGGSLTAGGAVELRLKNDGVEAYIEIDAEL